MRTRPPPSLLSLLGAAALSAACTHGGDPAPIAPRPSPSAATPPPATVPVDDDPIPTGQLPKDTRPLASTIDLDVDPANDRFSGAVEIKVDLSKPRTTI